MAHVRSLSPSPAIRDTTALLVQFATSADSELRAGLLDTIVSAHLGLCTSMAARYAGRGIDLDDLIQVARLALVASIRRYRPRPSFTAFAVATIDGELKRHFRDHGWVIRPPRALQELRLALRRAEEAAWQSHGGSGDASALARDLGVDVRAIREAQALADCYRPSSLDDHDVARMDIRGAEDDDEQNAATRLSLLRALDQLTSRDQRIVMWRFVDRLTQQQIADRLGVSQMQVSRLLSGILAGLRTELAAA
jgi:RNA polymerase sigma-B factor